MIELITGGTEDNEVAKNQAEGKRKSIGQDGEYGTPGEPEEQN